MPQPVHCLAVRPRSAANPRDRRLLADAHALGLTAVTALQAADLYFLAGDLAAADQLRLAQDLLSDPLIERHEWRAARTPALGRGRHLIEVALRPGVTDPVAEQIVRAAAELGVPQVRAAATGQRYLIHGRLTEADLHRLAHGLLANPVIQHYALGPIAPSFPEPAAASDRTEVIPVRALEAAGALARSPARRAARGRGRVGARPAGWRGGRPA
ncbi:MAG: phosphoribosylformylglycinamidine synthase subunit PurS, partial [Anaerolineales bacterium]|nr:phosphoribosylformylglycinamidine synthase subunit PurS [Anaerolineales bacterium]